ncbi:hypothetical protein C8R43DRAFT_1137419 [Mycena crocata]|nr:hypothetical protein C8R43DRAFT_1137419 [Mycena crocata]
MDWTPPAPLPNVAASEAGLCRSICKTNTKKLTASLSAEKADNDDNAQAMPAPCAPGARAPRVKLVLESISQEEDNDFNMSALEDMSDSDDSDSEDEPITDLLSSKTCPASIGASLKLQTRCKATSEKHKQTTESVNALATKKALHATVEEVEDEDDCPKALKNPIYLFHEVVAKNSSGTTGKPGGKHDKCHHGGCKIITITKAMCYNVGGAWIGYPSSNA